MPKLELEIMRLGGYRAIEISTESEEILGGGTPYYPLLSIKLNVTLKPKFSVEDGMFQKIVYISADGVRDA